MTHNVKNIVSQKRADAIKAFTIHFVIFTLVNIVLFVVNLRSVISNPAQEIWWMQWVYIGWSIGIVWHANCVFTKKEEVFAEWEKRQHTVDQKVNPEHSV